MLYGEMENIPEEGERCIWVGSVVEEESELIVFVLDDGVRQEGLFGCRLWSWGRLREGAKSGVWS